MPKSRLTKYKNLIFKLKKLKKTRVRKTWFNNPCIKIQSVIETTDSY